MRETFSILELARSALAFGVSAPCTTLHQPCAAWHVFACLQLLCTSFPGTNSHFDTIHRSEALTLAAELGQYCRQQDQRYLRMQPQRVKVFF